MKIVDVNVMISAVNVSDARHEQSRAWIDAALVGNETIGFTWIAMLAFVRLMTKVGLFPNPMSVPDATDRLREWLAQPAGVIVEPSARHFDVLSSLLAEVGAGGNLVSDAHLAAIAVEHAATIVTFDTDFQRFRGVASEPPGVATR